MRVDGVTAVQRALASRLTVAQWESEPSVVVGFTQRYAVCVHERHAYHKVGQWKYLETPARMMANDGSLGHLVSEAVKAGKTVEQGLLVAGLMLQRVSQDEYVPTDTTALKASGFTAVESELDARADRAFGESETVRIAALERRAKRAAKTVVKKAARRAKAVAKKGRK